MSVAVSGTQPAAKSALDLDLRGNAEGASLSSPLSLPSRKRPRERMPISRCPKAVKRPTRVALLRPGATSDDVCALKAALGATDQDSFPFVDASVLCLIRRTPGGGGLKASCHM